MAMSNLLAIGVVLGTLFTGGFWVVWVANTINMRFDAIVTGVIDGTRLSLNHRRLMLYNMYYQYLGGVIGVSTVLALGFVQMANHMSDPGIRNLAYAAAAIAAFPAGTWAVVGITGGLYCSKVLRQAEAD